MKKKILIFAALLASFGFGFAFKAAISEVPTATTRKATGIGGIFFKCKDTKKVREWYHSHLGLATNQYGSVFQYYQGIDSTKKGFLQWSPFGEKTKYFEPSTKDFMINYRVENLRALVAEFKRDSVVVTDTIESYDYGQFVHIMDIEGNKVELWQPNDVSFSKISGGVTK